jgi:hypothetical protein
MIIGRHAFDLFLAFTDEIGPRKPAEAVVASNKNDRTGLSSLPSHEIRIFFVFFIHMVLVGGGGGGESRW